MLKRIKSAFHTNDVQVESVLMLTTINICVCASCKNIPWWGYLLFISFYPLIAFIANLICPIPEDKDNDGIKT